MGQTVVGGDVMDDVTAWTRVAHVHVRHVWHVRALAPTVWRVCDVADVLAARDSACGIFWA